MEVVDQWFVKTEDGKVFGPIDLKSLVGWAHEGRIASTAMVSQDRQTWSLASMMPDLDMTWLIEVSPRQFYGPMPASALDDLVKAGKLSATARRFHLDRGEAAAKIKMLEDEVAAKDAALATLQQRFAETSETTAKTVQALESRLAKLHEEADKAAGESRVKVEGMDKDMVAMKREIESRDNDIVALRASIEAAEEKVRFSEERARAAESALASQTAIFNAERVTMESERMTLKSAQSSLQSEMDRSEKSTASLQQRIAELENELAAAQSGMSAAAPEVIEAEIVSDEPPPMAAPAASAAAGSLAELEAQAQRELARMGKRGGMFFGR